MLRSALALLVLCLPSGESVSARERHSIPEYMWDVYRDGTTRNRATAEVVRGVTPKSTGSFHRSQRYPNHIEQEIEFLVPRPSEGEVLTGAEVRVTTKGMSNASVMIFQKGMKWVYLDGKVVAGDWVALEVSEGVLQRQGSVSFLVVIVFRSREVKLELRPALLLSYRSRGTRQRRNVEEYEEETNRIWNGSRRNACRRKPLRIEFSEIDYDTWIVAPSGYDAFQCVGKCTFPVGQHLSPTKHAIVQTLMHHISPAKAVRACCVPTRLDPISVLYVDSHGVLTYRLHYKDMVVAECGCR